MFSTLIFFSFAFGLIYLINFHWMLAKRINAMMCISSIKKNGEKKWNMISKCFFNIFAGWTIGYNFDWQVFLAYSLNLMLEIVEWRTIFPIIDVQPDWYTYGFATLSGSQFKLYTSFLLFAPGLWFNHFQNVTKSTAVIRNEFEIPK